jgi:hypothetical protein
LGGAWNFRFWFFNKSYQNLVPDNPGGGTVAWTNPWGEHKFDILKIGKMEDTGFFKVIKQLCHSVERTNGR